jgi:hypothetical protein
MDQDITVGFAPEAAVYFSEDDKRIAGHVNVETPVAAGV